MRSNKSDIVGRFTINDNTPPLMFKGRVINVRPSTLSVDIYIPRTNKTYYGVYFGEGVLAQTYRSGGLPDVGSEVVVTSYSRTDAPVIVACVPPNQFGKSDLKFEMIYPGEYQIMSSGAAYTKFDRGGNAYIGGAGAASSTKTSDGATVNYQLKDISIGNFSKKELRTETKDDIMSIYGKSVFYETSDIHKYSADEILANPDLKNTILNDARHILTVLFGGDTAGESPSGRTLFDCLQIVIDNALNLMDFENDFEIYKARTRLAKLTMLGKRLSVEVFGENNFSIKLLDANNNLVSGITMDADGGRLLGTWVPETIE